MDVFDDFQFQTTRFKRNVARLPVKDQEFIFKAYDLAQKQHKDQKRHDGTPYFIHCLRISSNLMERMKVFDKEIIAAALLHDTVEDTDTKIKEIQEKFGERVAEIVLNLTRDTRLETEENKYQKKLEKHKETLKKDLQTRQIKTLDHLDNARSRLLIPHKPEEEQKYKRWIKETKTIHIPMAKTVNDTIADEIEDILDVVSEIQENRNPI
jgi:GTP pyrophosphokinase